MTAIIVIVGLVAIVALVTMWIFNGMIRSRNRCDNAWSQIDVQLKRRHDLVPNLVETVKGYAAHERGTLNAVVVARTNAMTAVQGGSIPQRAEAENVLSGALKNLFALSEAYPQLKANQNFLALQEELSSTEDRVAFSRQFYNDAVQRYNTMIQTAPRNLIARRMNFGIREFFTVTAAEQAPVTVQF
ncbi:MAG: LemA protein [Ilumatobacteraceae bacterium]